LQKIRPLFSTLVECFHVETLWLQEASLPEDPPLPVQVREVHVPMEHLRRSQRAHLRSLLIERDDRRRC